MALDHYCDHIAHVRSGLDIVNGRKILLPLHGHCTPHTGG